MTFHATPQGKFFCKGCQKHIAISSRHGRYGKYCVACHNKGEKK